MSSGAKMQVGSGRFIVMLGTSFDTRGGVSSVVNVYRQNGLFERWPIIYLPTHCDGGAAGKLALVVRSFAAYVRLLLRGRVAIVHVHASSWISFWRKLPFILVACAARKPFIFHLHGGNFDGFYAAMGSLRKRLIRFVLDRAARIVVLSSQWSTWMHGVSANPRVVCVHNPVAVPAEAAPLAQQQRLLFLGRMNRGKGIYDLLDVVAGLRARHPQLRLTCAGDGEAEQVGARARELGIGDAVEIPGWVDAQARDALIASSTILVLPSYFEGLPMSVLEAMAAGMPAGGTPVGGIPDLIEDGVDGYMVTPGDQQALMRALDRLLADPTLQKQIGAAARRKIEERFSADVLVLRLEKFYAELQVAPAPNLSRSGAARAARVWFPMFQQGRAIMKTAPQLQSEVRDFWDNKPCNSELSAHEYGSRQFFLEIEASRYHYEAHINDILDKIDWRGKKVLEIGTGVGTDARNLIARGASYTGINIDAGSTQISNRALSTFGSQPTVQQASATDMPFEDGAFDVVYCFGVLMCIPEVDRAISEIRRVVKPGGMILIMVYNRSSINYHVEIMFLRKLALRLLLAPGMIGVFSALGFDRQKLQRHVELFRANGPMDDAEWLSRNTDGPDHPYTLVYGRQEARVLCRDFDILANETYFFDERHWGFIGRMMPRALIRWLGKKWGWHRVVHAVKPAETAAAG